MINKKYDNFVILAPIHCVCEFVGLNPGQVIPKSFKNDISCLVLSIKKAELGNRTGLPIASLMQLSGISSYVLTMIFHFRQHT